MRECVCLSECTLPGLIALAERFGRFGFGFEKEVLDRHGGRPCAYLDGWLWGLTKDLAEVEGRDGEFGAQEKRQLLHGLSNVYRPVDDDPSRIRDFMHEREWRVFDDMDLDELRPRFFIAPDRYLDQMKALFGEDVLVFPIDLLHQWGI